MAVCKDLSIKNPDAEKLIRNTIDRIKGINKTVQTRIDSVINAAIKNGDSVNDAAEDIRKGSIPARAGEPRSRYGFRRRNRVYPRACGGTLVPSNASASKAGLSPRVRGNLGPQVGRDFLYGSIPARAGEPSICSAPSTLPKVYPRACGGTLFIKELTRMVCGLSPRVRGNQEATLTSTASQGSIPARAGEPEGFDRSRHVLGVYPRACGGTFRRVVVTSSDKGLSPRVRGNPFRCVGCPVPLRSIPARAGEPCTGQVHIIGYRVYPRACGGTITSVGSGHRGVGLSPRVRGNQDTVAVRNQDSGSYCIPERGSIPARAGEPGNARAVNSRPWVYPRACGGTFYCRKRHRALLGLSPRVRGNRPRGERAKIDAGSIPARAGEPSAGSGRRRAGRVYPRVCGGTCTSLVGLLKGMGLSPRVRGNLHFAGGIAEGHGSIPACAGEPSRIGSRVSPLRVYPRVCGGTNPISFETFLDTGLSPRVRGNQLDGFLDVFHHGSIPACAGEPAPST